MAFWGVEVLPGKAFTTKPLFALKVTKATIAAGASDHARSVVQVKAEDKLFACASLKLDSQDSADLDLVFEEQEDVTFVVTGKNAVHLTGYYMPEDDDEGFDGEEYPFGDSDEEIGSENQGESGSEDDDEEEEIPAPVAPAGGNKRKANGAPQQQQQEQQPKKQKQEQKGQPQQQQQQQAKPKTPQGQKGGQQGGKPNTPEGQKGGQQKSQPNTPKPQGQQGGKPQEGSTQDLGDKLKAVILKAGTGSAHALSGQNVVVKYVGKLDSGKIFDTSSSFPFKLGAGDVISGWDRGVAGMTIGEQRRLIVPPHLAYGRDGVKGAIPPNATLTFDVELVKIGGRR